VTSRGTRALSSYELGWRKSEKEQEVHSKGPATGKQKKKKNKPQAKNNLGQKKKADSRRGGKGGQTQCRPWVVTSGQKKKFALMFVGGMGELKHGDNTSGSIFVSKDEGHYKGDI